MTDPRTPAEIAEALEALAVENDEMDAIVSGGEHRAPLLRAAAAKIRALEGALKPFAAWADAQPDDRNTDRRPVHGFMWNGEHCLISTGDLRAARSALARGED